MEKKGKVFIISGPSGVGKTTITQNILAEISGIKRSISCTTRKPRQGEHDNIDYRFITKKRFKELVKQKAFLEWACVLNNYYGTLKKDVENFLQEGADVLLCIDVQGAQQISAKIPEAISIFVLPPDLTELKKRLANRGEDLKETNKRMMLAKQELQKAHKYDYTVTNDCLQKATKTVKHIIRTGKSSKKQTKRRT
ncbi:MAG: guanylate kinase [Candidatus Saelkia tenebricola]|nr:guanylate kinase [Candidatus Saelkia tenebricola]